MVVVLKQNVKEVAEDAMPTVLPHGRCPRHPNNWAQDQAQQDIYRRGREELPRPVRDRVAGQPLPDYIVKP